MEGLVMRSTGSWYEVRDLTTDEVYQCRLRGKFKIKGLKVTNPLAVGDIVTFELEDTEEETGVITHIKKRENYLIRKSTRKVRHGHIIGANLDQAILVCTLVMPRTSQGFIDRFLVSCESYHIPAVLVFNKADLLVPEAQQIQEELMELYESLGYQCLSLSAKKKEGLDAFMAMLEGKKSILSGHSGVGKSTLINAIAPDIDQWTQEVSTYANKGVHTTTFAEMFEIEEGTFLIDTPGIKELGLMDIKEEEIGGYFPEFRALMSECRFYNCSHTHEPGCVVTEAVKRGYIDEGRYMSYLSMMEGDDNRR
ncbi:ribosome small subunit-dependent GTPase A [Persicobacter psychrovividus]|uniref:Small ribosomal subunit biogenesis GTPase RsgA n=1 Tax=Persicobacter psychrovividus TaxID=387638 RepID=A0ABM7VB44_9BACT|nr:putative ribosome biogenesis GTPase RsgA 2 [Persicobacter psychrovividus]